ncbi:MAG: protein kinase domain-containing protein [Phycisphaerae bacterium]
MDPINDTRTNRDHRDPLLSDIDRALRDAPTPQPIPFPEIAGYRVLRKRGEGGQGTVFEAEELATHRRVCIKVLRDRDLAQDADRARFDLEIRTLAAIRHDAIVPIFSAGQTASGAQYCVMPLIEGAPITHYAAVKCPGPREVLALMAEVCRAIGHVHRNAHMIHRDLKPSNILVDAEGKPTVLDFGLARPLGVQLSGLTQSREVLGTAAYMSPEQTRESSNKLTATSDVYSLGVVLFELLTGQLPYRVQPDNWVASTLIIQHEEPPPPSRVLRAAGGSTGSRAQRIDADVDTIVLKALGKEPQHRYADAIELADDIERYLRGEAIVAKRHSTSYIAYRRLRRFASTNVLATQLMCVLVAASFTQYLASEFISRVTPLDVWFTNVASRFGGPAAAPTEMRHVSVLTIGGPEQMRAAAALAEVEWPEESGAAAEAPSSADTPRRRADRLVFARLLDRLAQSKTPPRVVVFNIAFRHDSAGDGEFVAAVARLREVGCRLMIARERHGAPSPQSRPSALIDAADRNGLFHARVGAAPGWELTLLIVRSGVAPAPTGPMLAFALARHPESDPRFSVSDDLGIGHVDYFNAESREGVPDDLAPREVVRFSGVTEVVEPELGLERGDVTPFIVLNPPPTETTDAATKTIDAFFSASDAELARFAAERVVVIGFDRNLADRVRDHGGAMRPFVLLPAVGIEQLLSGRVLQLINPWPALAVVLLACGFGTFLGRVSATRVAQLCGVLLVCAILIVLGALLTARLALVACNPFIPIAGLVCAAALSAGVQRAHLADRRI